MYFNLSGLCLDLILAGNFNCYIILIHMNQKYLWFILRLTSKEVRDEAVESSEIFSFLSEFCRWITLQHLLQNHYMWYKFDNFVSVTMKQNYLFFMNYTEILTSLLLFNKCFIFIAGKLLLLCLWINLFQKFEIKCSN